MATAASTASNHNGKVRLLGILVIVAGAIMIVAGVVTWVVVKGQLENENITVADDADQFAGPGGRRAVHGVCPGQLINKHALESTGGLTYAELPREPDVRQTAMTASFRRASLFTSVVAFGVAFMAAGLGLVLPADRLGPDEPGQGAGGGRPTGDRRGRPDDVVGRGAAEVDQRKAANEPPASPAPAVTTERTE